MMNLFSFGSAAAELTLALEEPRGRARHPAEKAVELPLFAADEPLRGALRVQVAGGKRLEHTGVRIEFVGVIELPNERYGGASYEFTSLKRELEAQAGAIDGEKLYAFDFSAVERGHESYYGKTARLRYYIKATVSRAYASSLVVEQDILVQKVSETPPIDSSIKMEVGIEDCLHIEFEYEKSKYHPKDVVIGKVFFLLVRIKIKHMELAIIRREVTGTAADKKNDSETLAKFEIMDGAPVKGESIPVRLYLSPYNLTPAYSNVHNKFSVRSFLNLVLVDEEDRRYFKQQEIFIYRKAIGS